MSDYVYVEVDSVDGSYSIMEVSPEHPRAQFLLKSIYAKWLKHLEAEKEFQHIFRMMMNEEYLREEVQDLLKYKRALDNGAKIEVEGTNE